MTERLVPACLLVAIALLASGCIGGDPTGDSDDDGTDDLGNGGGDTSDSAGEAGDDGPSGNGTDDPPEADDEPPSDDAANATTNATDDAPAGASQEVSGTLVFQGESCLASRAYAATGTIPVGTPLDGVTRIVFDVDPDTIGQAYQVAWTFDQGYIDAATFFTTAGGQVISQRIVDGPNFGGVDMAGTVPEGAEVGVLYACGGPAEAHVEYTSTP